MPKAHSPLRYPGGKSCMLDEVAQILRINKLERGHYAEPYAGGCGLALSLLFEGYVSDIHINDIDRSIWAFWNVVLNRTDEFIEKIWRTPVTVDEWSIQCEIQQNHKRADRFELAFATFFLNRTNRSGVIKNAGIIGGMSQDGDYKIDCRFNKEKLAKRIRRIRKYKSRIHLHKKDALIFIDHVEKKLPQDTFLCIDPPYFNKGARLYTSFYDENDHDLVARRILKLKGPWVITYDDVDEIRKLYKQRRQYEMFLNYSLQVKRRSSELLIASKGLIIPSDVRKRQVHRPQYRATG